MSLLNAALLCGVGYLSHGAAKREGGIIPAGRKLTRRVSELTQRVTGHSMSQAQAAFFVVAVAALVYKFVLSSGSTNSGYSSGYSSGRSSSSSSRRRARYQDGMRYEEDVYDYSGGYGTGWGAGWDLSFMISAGMLATMVYQLGGGRNGWSVGELIRRVQNMDFWQMMMFANLLQSVLGGGRRRGGMPMGGFGRRGMYY